MRWIGIGDSMNDKPIERKPVKSSNVKSVGFCPEGGCVEVEFIGGGVYRYSDCDQKLFDELMAADSVGKFVHARLKSRSTEKM